MHGWAQEPATEGFPFVALSASATAALGEHCPSYKCARGSAEAGNVTRFIKVKSHRGEPLNEAADILAAAAAELDPSRPLDPDPEAVYFMLNDSQVEWCLQLRNHLVQVAAWHSLAG